MCTGQAVAEAKLLVCKKFGEAILKHYRLKNTLANLTVP